MTQTRRTKKKASEELAYKISELCLTKKAEDVVILDLGELTTMTDYFVICSGSTDKQVNAITDAVVDGLEKEKIKPWHKEGIENAQWVLLDFVDVVAHIFLQETRLYYNLEQLWGDAAVTHISGENGPVIEEE
ncbi:ribosome silencing factor [candidate division KSB1 bacterium]